MTTAMGPTAQDAVSLKAVHDDDLVGYLARFGLAPDVGGRVGDCKFCHNAVTVDNLAAIFPLSGAVKLACDRPDCLRGVQDLIAEGRVRI